MNFTQWRGHAEKKAVSKVTYCCGEQLTLTELVVEDIKSILQAPPTDFFVIGSKNHNSVWDIATQHSLDPKANRLVIIRDAEVFNLWEDFYVWLDNVKYHPKTYVLFVSSESELPYESIKGKKVQYTDYIEAIKSKGKIIKCSTPNEEDMVKFCTSYGLTEQVARYLIEKSSGTVDVMYQVLKKIHIWGKSPNTKVIDALCDDFATDAFTDYLILNNKKAAHAALLTHDLDYTKIINHLNYRLDMLLEISQCLRKRMYDVEIATATGIKIFLVKKFKHVAKNYDFNKVKQHRQLLAFADAALQDGARTGVMETLVATW